ncbi:MAG: MotA/TolQ/ExbB proton channel family protein [Halomonas sp. BM-2019]|nr:MAG: MotA/TolQ/ExbB proton channel family protein [Halomonas sp. BM-2019]
MAIARERRAPELLALPLSIRPEAPWRAPAQPLPSWPEAPEAVEAAALRAFAAQQAGELREALSDSRLRLGSELVLPARPEAGVTGTAAITELLRHLETWTHESGRWRRFEAPVAGVDGQIAPRDVARVGDLLLFGGGDLLRPSGDDSAPRLAVVEGLDREQRAGLTAAWAGDAALLLDPTGGRLLDALARQPSLVERFHQGGVVGYVVVALGGLGLLVALLQFLYLGVVRWRLRRQLRDLGQLRDDNPLGRVLGRFRTLPQGVPPEALEARLDEALLAELPRLERGQGLVKLLAAVAPLLGLLGTVTGMIVTFQAITVFGTGDPQLMAGGISQALVTTVLGLVTAVPLLFAHTALTSRSRGLVGLLEGKASAALAEHLEAPPTASSAVAPGRGEARLVHA